MSEPGRIMIDTTKQNEQIVEKTEPSQESSKDDGPDSDKFVMHTAP